MCRVDNILIPCPVTILIVTLLKIIQVKGHYDIPFKILLIFHKIIISISDCTCRSWNHSGQTVPTPPPCDLFSAGATVCLADSIPSTTIKIKKEILPKTPTSLLVL